MAFMNHAGDYHRAAEAVLAALGNGDLLATGTAYPLSEVTRAHADLEAGRSSGALYLVP
jgi:NADPH2:quinone reductase